MNDKGSRRRKKKDGNTERVKENRKRQREKGKEREWDDNKTEK